MEERRRTEERGRGLIERRFRRKGRKEEQRRKGRNAEKMRVEG